MCVCVARAATAAHLLLLDCICFAVIWAGVFETVVCVCVCVCVCGIIWVLHVACFVAACCSRLSGQFLRVAVCLAQMVSVHILLRQQRLKEAGDVIAYPMVWGQTCRLHGYRLHE